MSGETIKAYAGDASKIRFNDKAPKNELVLLYTEGFVTRLGIWQDGTGILGWAPMPEVNKDEREACLAQPHNGFRKKITMSAINSVWSSDTKDSAGNSDIETHAVESSQINSMSYSKSRKVMLVNFKNGASYEYANVDHERFTAIIQADSVGKAFNSLVKANAEAYPFTKLSA